MKPLVLFEKIRARIENVLHQTAHSSSSLDRDATHSSEPKAFDYSGIEVSSASTENQLDCHILRPGLAIWTVMNERVEHISDRDDARGERNGLSTDHVRITGAVPALVMMPRDYGSRLHHGRVAPGKKPRANDGMLTHYRLLLRRECA